MPAVRFLSIADIARRLDVPRHRVVWVLDAYAIPIAAQVGECRGYKESAVESVREHLSRIDSARLATV